MIPLYDIPICNFIGQPFQWLRTMADEETANDPTPALVYQVPKVASVQEAAMDERVRRNAAFDPDEIGCAAFAQVG